MAWYLNFIKSGQRFYRAYIQKLASHHGGIPELEYVAHQFKVESTSSREGRARWSRR